MKNPDETCRVNLRDMITGCTKGGIMELLDNAMQSAAIAIGRNIGKDLKWIRKNDGVNNTLRAIGYFYIKPERNIKDNIIDLKNDYLRASGKIADTLYIGRDEYLELQCKVCIGNNYDYPAIAVFSGLKIVRVYEDSYLKVG